MTRPDPPRLGLEPLRPDHASELFAALSDPAGYRFLPDDPPATRDALADRHARQMAGRSADGAETWLNWVIRLGGNGAAIGFTQATIRSGSALLGYQLAPAHWRQGLGTLAVRLTIDRLFSRSDVREVRACVDTRNQASIALLRRLGLTVSRTLPGADHFKGAPSDEIELVMTRADWQQPRPPVP